MSNHLHILCPKCNSTAIRDQATENYYCMNCTQASSYALLNKLKVKYNDRE